MNVVELTMERARLQARLIIALNVMKDAQSRIHSDICTAKSCCRECVSLTIGMRQVCGEAATPD
jgi:hypothetical protein